MQKEKEQFHFVGIGGIGMSGLARILLQRKHKVSGSDLSRSAVTESLSRAGAEVHYGHAAKHVAKPRTVVYSTDIQQDNPELRTAAKNKYPMLHRSELLFRLMEGYKPLAITGTHGKTTTTSLLTWVLKKAGVDPSYAIGGLLADVNAGHGKGEYFIAEADESDGSFLNYRPYGAILTNIDLDHMTHFGSEEALIQAFATFATRVESPQHCFWCADDRRLRALGIQGISYGFSSDATLRLENYFQTGWNSHFDLVVDGQRYTNIEVALTGTHNALNAAAVFGLALNLGVSETAIREGLISFPGVARRCERKVNKNGVVVIDDYAHHPTEIEATLNAIRTAIGAGRLIVVYQPHRYTRTQECKGQFGKLFTQADQLFLTDLYGSREKPIKGISHETVQNELEATNRVPLQYVPRKRLKAAIIAFARPHDVIVTLGAGDITELSSDLAAHFSKKAPTRWKVGFICGGVSVEHEVTLWSAKQVLPCLRKEFYDVKQFGITKQGRWIQSKDVVKSLEGLKKDKRVSGREVPLSPKIMKDLLSCDVIVPILHGTYGEDGIIQGFLDVFGKAYVGCHHRAAAIAMDKAVTKRLAQTRDIPVTPFIEFTKEEWRLSRRAVSQAIMQAFPFPIYVKPPHLGSSIEVHRVTSVQGLEEAIDSILCVDTHVMAEQEIIGREFEFAVFGNDTVVVLPPGETFSQVVKYDYKNKYSATGTPVMGTADLPPELEREGMQLAARSYAACGCSGLARIDFFLDQQNRWWLNEINPIPGFTKASMYPKILEANNIPLNEFWDGMVILALQRRRSIDRLEV